MGNRTSQKNKRGDSKVESNDSPEIPHRGETSDIPGLPSRGSRRVFENVHECSTMFTMSVRILRTGSNQVLKIKLVSKQVDFNVLSTAHERKLS